MQSRLTWIRKALPNGTRMLTYPKPSNLTAQLAVAVEYGANDDQDPQAGAAHFLEHMVPGGSETRIGLSREIEQVGGLAEFYTNHEYTLHTADVLPAKLARAAEILSTLVCNDAFQDGQFRSEQKIILQELAEAADDPNQQVNEMLLKNLFKNHPVRRPVGGNPKTVRCLSLAELTKIYLEHYVPKNLIVILTGNYSEEDARDVLQSFSQIQRKPSPEKQMRNAEVATPKRTTTKRKAGLVQSYLSVGARTTRAKSIDVAALDVLNVVLGVGASSRLFIELREKRALAYSVSSSQTDGLDFGFFTVDCATNQKQTKQATSVILKEFARLRNENVPEAELNKGKDMILSNIFRAVDNLEACPEILAFMEIQFGNENALAQYAQRVRAVTADQVRAVAERYLSEGSLSTAVLNPS